MCYCAGKKCIQEIDTFVCVSAYSVVQSFSRLYSHVQCNRKSDHTYDGTTLCGRQGQHNHNLIHFTEFLSFDVIIKIIIKLDFLQFMYGVCACLCMMGTLLVNSAMVSDYCHENFL